MAGSGSVLRSTAPGVSPGVEFSCVQPARELTFSNNWETDGWEVPTLITLRLTPLYDTCHVELFHHGFERLGSAASELQAYQAELELRGTYCPRPSGRSSKKRHCRLLPVGTFALLTYSGGCCS